MNSEIPVNKDAAQFLSRKRHILDVQEALNKFACAVCSPATVGEVRKIVKDRLAGDDQKTVMLTLRIRPDHQNVNKVSVTMETKVSKQLGTETFTNLDL